MSRLKPTSQKKRKRRAFLLLEILISLALVVTCLFPLLKPQWAMSREEQKNLEKMQLDREADLAFVKFKKLLYEKKYTWNQLCKKINGDFDNVVIYLGKDRTKEFKTTFVASYLERFSKRSTKMNYLLLGVKISFGEDYTYNYTLLIERKPNEVIS